MEQEAKNILEIIKNKHSSFDESRVLEELTFFEEHELFGSIMDLYNKAKTGRVGNKNLINSAVLFYLGVTAASFDASSALNIQPRRTYARSGFPDIDMDFDHRKRYLIEDYLRNKYGNDHYAVIGTKQKLKTKAAVRRVIKVLDPENNIVFDSTGKKIKDESDNSFKFEQSVLQNLPELMKRPDGTIVKNLKEATKEYPEFGRYMQMYPEVYENARVLENSLSAFSSHAAGRILSPIPLQEIAPLHYTQDYTDSYYRTGEKIASTQFEMNDIESLGLIKFDLLNLDTKAAISITKDLIKERYGTVLDLKNISFEDKATLNLLRTGKTDGVFQLENPGMKQAVSLVSVDCFNDLVAIIALYRPGPKDFIPVYAKRKKKQESFKPLHPILEKILSETYQIIVYQEQLMQAFVELANLPITDGYEFTKGCAKKKEKLIAKFEGKFKKGCLNNNISKELTDKIFEIFKKFGMYAFNKSIEKNEKILTNEGKLTIEELFIRKRNSVQLPKVFSKEGKEINIVDVYDHGILPVYKITFSDGSCHQCTLNHKFETDHGTLPLSAILENDYLVYKGIYESKTQTVCLRQRDFRVKNIRSSSQNLSDLYRNKKSKLFNIWQEKFSNSTAENQFKSRNQSNMDTKDIESCVTISNEQCTGKTEKIRLTKTNQQEVLSFNAKEQIQLCDSDIGKNRNSKRTCIKVKTMESEQSREFSESMHDEISSRDLDICSREIFNANTNSNWISAFSSVQRRKIFNKNQNKTNRFYKSRQENNSRIRWGTSFSRAKLDERFIVHSNFGQNSESSISRNAVYDNTNELRYFCLQNKTVKILGRNRANAINTKSNNRIVFHRQKVSIKSVQFAGYKQCYDLEVDSNDHLYMLASGVVNSNSHSVSYAEESFRTAWLKCHYPTEFICARLSVESHKKAFDEVQKYEQDAIHNFGFEIIGPDLNLSKMDYVILGDKKLLRPLCLKGIGDKAVYEIIKHQPYKGPDILKSFGMKVSSVINNRVIESMCDSKLFGPIKKSEVLKYFEKVKNDRKVLKKMPKNDLFE